MRALYVWLFVAAAVLSICIGVVMFVRMLTRAVPAERPEPPPQAVHVTGHGAEKVIAPRLTWTVDVCADTTKLATEHARDALARGKKIFAADELVMGEVTPDEDGHGQDAHTCVTFDLSTTRVAEAIRWHRGLLAAGLVEKDSAMDPECSGDETIAAGKARAAMTAIKDARAQADALLDVANSAARPGIEATVTHDEGSWDTRCERTITAEADLTIPTH